MSGPLDLRWGHRLVRPPGIDDINDWTWWDLRFRSEVTWRWD